MWLGTPVAHARPLSRAGRRLPTQRPRGRRVPPRRPRRAGGTAAARAQAKAERAALGGRLVHAHAAQRAVALQRSDARQYIGDHGQRVGRGREQVRMEDQREVALGMGRERGEHALAQRGRLHRRLGVAALDAPRREVRQVEVGVDQLPPEREHGQPAEPARAVAGRRAVAVAERGEDLRRVRVQAPARRPEADRAAECVARTRQTLGLVGHLVPRLVAPAVAGDLVAGRPQAPERLGVELAVEPFHEERGRAGPRGRAAPAAGAGTRGR